MKVTAKATQSPKASTPKGIPSTSNIMFELWERAAPSLDQEALKWFARGTEQAECIAANLQEVVEGIGCMVESDSLDAPGTPAGNFQSSNDVPALLYTIANAIDNIRGLILVGDLANDKLR